MPGRAGLARLDPAGVRDLPGRLARRPAGVRDVRESWRAGPPACAMSETSWPEPRRRARDPSKLTHRASSAITPASSKAARRPRAGDCPGRRFAISEQVGAQARRRFLHPSRLALRTVGAFSTRAGWRAGPSAFSPPEQVGARGPLAFSPARASWRGPLAFSPAEVGVFHQDRRGGFVLDRQAFSPRIASWRRTDRRRFLHPEQVGARDRRRFSTSEARSWRSGPPAFSPPEPVGAPDRRRFFHPSRLALRTAGVFSTRAGWRSGPSASAHSELVGAPAPRRALLPVQVGAQDLAPPAGILQRFCQFL